MRHAPVIWTAVGAIATAVIVAGCGAASATKAGKATGPVVLRMAERDAGPADDLAVADFVSRAGKLSGGALRIDIVSAWGNLAPDAEQQIVHGVAAGKADLGAVGTRVLDTLGVRSFQALTAPMLIDSYALERAVITSNLPGRMLPGLAKLGVTGLAVVGEGLRNPVAVKRPLLAPSDWRGITFAAFRSRGAAATIRAFGGRPSDLWGPAQSAALSGGNVQGAENDLITYYGNARQDVAPYVTANVNLWPRTELLLANAARFSKLTSEQRGWLRQAAAAAAADSTSLFDHDGRVTAALCKSGAHFTNASRAQLAALRRALEPVYAGLEQDPQTKTLIAQIEELKRSTPSRPALAIPVGCTGPASTAAARNNRASVLNGVYRVKWSEKELIAAGAPSGFAHGDFGWAHGNQVVLTMTLRDGQFTVQAASAPWSPCPGTYSVSSKTVSIAEQPPSCQGRIVARWSIQKGQLRLRVSHVDDPVDAVTFGAKPWTKIAGVHSSADETAVNGTYRFTISDADLKANGVTGDLNISQNHGIFTWVLHDGRWQVHQRANNPLPGSANGNFGGLYTVKDDRITFEPPTGPGAPQGGSPITVRWKLASGELRFTVIGASDPILRTWFTARPWKKIG